MSQLATFRQPAKHQDNSTGYASQFFDPVPPHKQHKLVHIALEKVVKNNQVPLKILY